MASKKKASVKTRAQQIADRASATVVKTAATKKKKKRNLGTEVRRRRAP